MGKGKSSTKEIKFSEINVEFITVKEDKFNNNVYYFKVNEENTKLVQLIQSGKDKNYILPLWITKEDNIIIKIKEKFIKKFKYDTREDYIISVNFIYFEINEETKGYYVKQIDVKNKETNMEIEIVDDN